MDIKKSSYSDLTDAALQFWYNDHKHIRSPFPKYIRDELKNISVKRFSKWIESLTKKAEKDVNDEIVAEKFEEILFEEALKLVLTEDEKITILYPFLPRIGDKSVMTDSTNQSTERLIIDRVIVKEGEISFLKVIYQDADSDTKGETRFELPI